MVGSVPRVPRARGRRVLQIVLLWALLAALARRVQGQLVAGGMFNRVAEDEDPYFHRIAQWRGTLNSTKQPEWLKLRAKPSSQSEWHFGVNDRVLALAFVPGQQWLIIGGDIGGGKLLRAGRFGQLPGPSEFDPMYYFYKPPVDGTLQRGAVHALEYVAKSGESYNGDEWDLFLGGDFTFMSATERSMRCSDCTTSQYVARCVYTAGETRFAPLPAAGSAPGSAPDSPVSMLAFDREAQILYTGGSEAGSVRKYSVSQESWSALDPAVGMDATMQPRDLLVDPVTRLGFIAFRSASNGGVRIFTNDGSASAFPALVQANANFSALAVGTDGQHGRVVFAAGSSAGCPILWVLPLDNSPSDAQWQSRQLKANDGGCSNLASDADAIVQTLAYIEQDNVLFMAGGFTYVGGTSATNIAISRDAGHSWGALSTAGLQEGVTQAGGQKGATVTALVAFPQVDVTAVVPPHVPPRGGAVLTLLGAGFNAFPTAGSPLDVWVGDSKCQPLAWVADSSMTCNVSPGYGNSLEVSVGLGAGRKFKRQTHPFSYTAPRLGTVGRRLTDPVSASLGGDEMITVLGSNFGCESQYVSITIGESGCSDAAWISDSSLRCKLAPGAGGSGEPKSTSLGITAKVGLRDAELSDIRFSYLPPSVSAVIPSTVPTTGMTTRITVLGRSFGSSPQVARQIMIGSAQCNDAAGWVSDTAVACSAPGPGVGSIALSMTVASQPCSSGCSDPQDGSSSSSAALLKYDPPKITSIAASDRHLLQQLPVHGSKDALITIHGSGFGTEEGAAVSLGATSCSLTVWSSDSKILCQPAPGAGANLQLKVEVGGQQGVAEDEIKYQDPELSTLTPRMLPRDGGTVTVVGSHFLSDPSAYAAVWRRKEDASQQEYLGTIQSITQLEQGLQQRIIVRAPTMEWRGSALLFLRVVTPPGAGDEEARTQTSNVLYPTCLPGSQTLGTDKACIQFSERSPVISVEMATAVGSGEDALVQPLNNANSGAGYDFTRWRQALSRSLNMPTPDLVYIQSVQLREEGRRDERKPAGGAQHAGMSGMSGSSAAGVRGGWPIGRRQGIQSLRVQLFFLSDDDAPRSYQKFLKSLEELLDAEQGRLLLKDTLGVMSLSVGTDSPVELAAPAAAPGPPVPLPVPQDGFICVGGARAGEPCAGNASLAAEAAMLELLCPGGGACVRSGGVGAGIAASWSFGAILGGFVVMGMSLIAVGMKISADHRRKKRAYQASVKDRAQRPHKDQKRTHAEGEEWDDLEDAGDDEAQS